MSLATDALSALTAGAKGAAAGSVLGPIGSVAGGAIGVAMDLLPSAAHWLGADEGTAQKVVQTVQAVTGATTAPEQRAALAADPGMADDLRVQLAQIAAERAAEDNRSSEARLSAQIADVASARAQTVQLAQAGSGLAWGGAVVSVVVALGFFAAFGMMILAPVQLDAGRAAMLNILVGVLGGGFTTMLTYWLGSSAGSARKSELMAQRDPIPPNPGVVVPAGDVQPAR
jgi:hypothetical protein